MGKSGGGGYSLFDLVKKAFRSPSKDTQKTSSRRRDHSYYEQEEEKEEEKKPGKRLWLSRKPEKTIAHKVVDVERNAAAESRSEKQTMAMAMATAAAAEAVAATAQAAVEMIRLTRPFLLVKEQQAATRIQTAFRGYLGRKALGALKGVVKLQAVIRGHNVRRRAKMTLKCMQSLVRVQTQVCDRRRRLSCDQGRMDWSHRRSTSRTDLGATATALQRERLLAYAFSQQMWSSSKEEEDRVSYEELCDTPRFLGHESIIRRASFDHPRDPPPFTRTVEMDTARSCPVHSPRTPPRSIKPISVSPQCRREEEGNSHPTPETPNSLSGYFQRASHLSRTPRLPNYMAATVSAKARSQSAPRQQRLPATPDREYSSSAKKRLSFPAAVESDSWDDAIYNRHC